MYFLVPGSASDASYVKRCTVFHLGVATSEVIYELTQNQTFGGKTNCYPMNKPKAKVYN